MLLLGESSLQRAGDLTIVITSIVLGSDPEAMRRSAAHHLAVLLFVLLVLSRSRLAAAAATDVAGAPAGRGVPAEPLLPCLEELLPCTAYLRTSRSPSQTCCTALHRATAAEMPCLCRLLADPELLATFNVTREQMFRLPARCGLPVGCRAGAAGMPVVDAPPPPAVTPPRRDGDPSHGDRCRRSVGRMIASVFLGGLVSIAVLF